MKSSPCLRICLVQVLILFLILLNASAIFAQNSITEELVINTFHAGSENLQSMIMTSIDNKQAFQTGTLWNLNKIDQVTGNVAYQDTVKKMIGFTEEGISVRLVDSTAARPMLPVDPGKGLLKFFCFVEAATGQPDARAVSFINRFTSKSEQGYVLTHQLLVIEWAIEQGKDLPDKITKRRSSLLEKIRKEQNWDLRFSDLYAERAAMLLLFGEVNKMEADKWIAIIIQAQQENGSWGEYSKKIIFDGKTFISAREDPSHTSSWVLLALSLYINQYDSNQSSKKNTSP